MCIVHDMMPTLLFPNHLEEKEATRVCYSNGRLWRMDSSRIVSVRIKSPCKGHHEYDIQGLEDVSMFAYVEVNEEGVLKIGEQDNPIVLLPESTSICPISVLKAFGQSENSRSVPAFKVETRALMRYLIQVNAFLTTKQVDMKTAFLRVDFSTKKLHLVGLNQPLSLTIEVVHPSTEVQDYSFQLFSDLLVGSRTVTSAVHFEIPSPYFTQIRYHERAEGILTHRRSVG